MSIFSLQWVISPEFRIGFYTDWRRAVHVAEMVYTVIQNKIGDFVLKIHSMLYM